MAILFTILMSLGLVANPNLDKNTAVDHQTETNHAGTYGSGNWEWDNNQ